MRAWRGSVVCAWRIRDGGNSSFSLDCIGPNDNRPNKTCFYLNLEADLIKDLCITPTDAWHYHLIQRLTLPFTNPRTPVLSQTSSPSWRLSASTGSSTTRPLNQSVSIKIRLLYVVLKPRHIPLQCPSPRCPIVTTTILTPLVELLGYRWSNPSAIAPEVGCREATLHDRPVFRVDQ